MSSEGSVPVSGDDGDAGLPAAAGSDPRAEFDRLIREHNDALLNYAYARVRSWADAKDVVHEAYVKIFDLGSDRPISHLRAYLYKTVRNCATDWVRKRNTREHFATLQGFGTDEESASAEYTWLLRDEIKQTLDVLPPKCRLAMILVNVRGLSYEEAAECMRIKASSVRRLLERAVEHLVESLQPQHGQNRRRP